jgi:hypothetical protein
LRPKNRLSGGDTTPTALYRLKTRGEHSNDPGRRRFKTPEFKATTNAGKQVLNLVAGIFVARAVLSTPGQVSELVSTIL